VNGDERVVIQPVVTPEVAEIDRDREITRALIESAAQVVAQWIATDPKERADEDQPVFDESRAFLKSWYTRKQPTLDGVPKL
jgi:hypothetical protein